MSIKLIAHRIDKDQRSKEISHFLREKLISDSEDAQRLLAELRKALSRKSHPGQFAEEAGEKPTFQLRLERYMKAMTDKEFITLSHDLTKLLEKGMKEQVMATGGFVVFAEHKLAEDTLLLVALLSTEARTTFDAQMNPIASATLDFDHLRHGVRVRHAGVATNEPGLLQFVAQKADGVSDYFREFLGCEKLPDTSAQGRLLISVLDEVAKEHGLDIEEANSALHNYWQQCRKEDKDLSLTGLANLLNPDNPEGILSSLNDEKYGLPGNFAPPPKRVMDSLINFSYSANGLKLQLNKVKWADKISVNKTTVQIKNAPPELIAKLQEEILT
ncbi:nucleoid-associated protein YejK [Prosthecobacter algae]|uniref:Nucleoid-associated protein YejK n=1 Tax=Prosthecobacter algae TaxID=1144682 RepID=A0ABP9NWD8_9BACT